MTQTDCPQSSFGFQDLGSRKVQANFQGGHLSSDGGGAVFLREVEQCCGLIRGLARCFDDRRNQELIEHPVANLLSQRINGLILGYEDLNDHDDLRLDAGLEGTTPPKFRIEPKSSPAELSSEITQHGKRGAKKPNQTPKVSETPKNRNRRLQKINFQKNHVPETKSGKIW